MVTFFTISVATIILWNYLGSASLTGLGAIVLLMSINAFLASKIKRVQVIPLVPHTPNTDWGKHKASLAVYETFCVKITRL